MIHASAFNAATMNMIQKENLHPRRVSDIQPPTIGPRTTQENSQHAPLSGYLWGCAYRDPSMVRCRRATMQSLARAASTCRLEPLLHWSVLYTNACQCRIHCEMN